MIIFVGMKEISIHLDQIKQLCTKNRVKSLFAFGSVLTDRFRPDSDIDLIVDIDEIDPISYSDKYFNLKFQLEEIFKRHVDLLESRAIRNPYFLQQINNTKVLVYGG